MFTPAQCLTLKNLAIERVALDGGLLFQGEYRVWHLRVTDVRRFTDRGEALAHNPR